MRRCVAALLSSGLCVVAPALCAAQEIEPRAYANTPVNLNFLAVGYVYQGGNVFFDPALPIEGASGQIHVAFARYLRSLSIGGKPVKASVSLPLTSGHWEGLVDGQFRTRDTRGMADARMSFDVLLWGARARRLGERPGAPENTVVGVGLTVVLPSGTYDDERIINLGSNRWALRPRIGVSHTIGTWTLEGTADVWLFGDNGDFLGGQTLSQERLVSFTAMAIRTFRPGVWLAGGVGYGRGGSSTVEGVQRNTLQSNWRFGVVFAYALAPAHGVSFSVSSGVTTRTGSDFNTFGASYQYLWGGR